MARKDLSRTVIEGGRYYHNSYFRRASHGIERATTREWLDRVATDLEEAEETLPPPRKHVGKMFRDKLGPAKRWLAAQVGRPWSKVYSELCAKFDSRTIAGRHVVHDHMLPWVDLYNDPLTHHSNREFFIDSHGILRKGGARNWWKLRSEVLAWAGSRRCANTYRGWWWFRAEAVMSERCSNRYHCDHPTHREIAGGHYHRWNWIPLGPVRPGQLRYLDKLPAVLRNTIVIASPWR